jgi:hypothetical protein
MNLSSFLHLKVLVIKTLDPELKPDPHRPKMLDPDPHSMRIHNTDPGTGHITACMCGVLFLTTFFSRSVGVLFFHFL